MLATNPIVILVVRVALAALYVVSGVQKLIEPSHMAAFAHRLGMPEQLPLAIGTFEVLAGAAFIAAFRLSWVAIALAVWTILTALVAHRFWNDPTQLPDFFKNIGLAGAFVLFARPKAVGRPKSANAPSPDLSRRQR